MLTRGWNWKSAILSALCRAPVFFAANMSAGMPAAVAAFQTEFCFRLVAAGFYGGITEAFSRVRPARAATLGALIVVPGLAHAAEFLVHWWAGTSNLGASIGASVLMSMVTTRISLFVMRRGLFVVRGRPQSLQADILQFGRLLARGAMSVTAMLRGRRRLTPQS